MSVFGKTLPSSCMYNGVFLDSNHFIVSVVLNSLKIFLILQKIKKHKLDHKWFDAFNLARIKDQNINTLSGGEKQKLFLSRIMSLNQNNLFLDEPNQSLDLESEKLFVDLLSQEKHNKTILLTLHDFEIAKKIADLIIYLDRGKIYMYEETYQFFNKFHV